MHGLAPQQWRCWTAPPCPALLKPPALLSWSASGLWRRPRGEPSCCLNSQSRGEAAPARARCCMRQQLHMLCVFLISSSHSNLLQDCQVGAAAQGGSAGAAACHARGGCSLGCAAGLCAAAGIASQLPLSVFIPWHAHISTSGLIPALGDRQLLHASSQRALYCVK